MNIFAQITSVVFGLIIGSFLSVCVYRLALGRQSGLEDFNVEEDEDAEGQEEVDLPPQPNHECFEQKVTLFYPRRSFCPKCGNQLKWYHNVPVFSWLLLRGKCGFCKSPISARYPVIEFLTAVLSYLSYISFGATPTGFVAFAFCCALLVISFIDYDIYIIPNVITYPATMLGILTGITNDVFSIFSSPVVPGVKMSVFGILAGAGFLLLISEGYFRLRKKQGLGLGDVKLLAMTGAFFGPEASLYTIFMGSLLGSVVGVLLMLIGGRGMSSYLPFGPYLAFATLLYIFTDTMLMKVFFEHILGMPPMPV